MNLDYHYHSVLREGKGKFKGQGINIFILLFYLRNS